MRTSGILMHISSLPSPYGIGTMGKEAYRFVDFLCKADQSWWQMLPVGQTSYGDSPYQSFSSYAGNPYFIDLDFPIRDRLLKKEEVSGINWGEDPLAVDYGRIYENRFSVLRIACGRLKEKLPKDYKTFEKEQKGWLHTYALFMALKDAHNGKSWMEWEEPLRFRQKEAIREAEKKYAKEIEFYKLIQYLFFHC